MSPVFEFTLLKMIKKDGPILVQFGLLFFKDLGYTTLC